MPLQATSGAASYDAFGGGVAAVPNYIEDVFSTYLYTGTSPTNQTITNGIDLSTKGGLVWFKRRDSGSPFTHELVDTVQGAGKFLSTPSTSGWGGAPSDIQSFNSNGFTINDNTGLANTAGAFMVSWTFRKQPKFFDVVTWTGDGTGNINIPHNLGSVPGCIMMKKTSAALDWYVYHRELNYPNAGNPQNNTLKLNTTDAGLNSTAWQSGPTSTYFPVLGSAFNVSGATYVAYLFAHNAGGFGLIGTDNVISCGSFTPDGSGNATVNLGYEPQWLLYKRSDSSGNWWISDQMRGFGYSGTTVLYPNLSNAEALNFSTNGLVPTATGFQVNGQLTAGATYIYIAIRRGPMKVPTSGTSVFSPVARTGTGANATVSGVGFPPDLFIGQIRGTAGYWNGAVDRLRGVTKRLVTSQTNAEDTTTDAVTSFTMDGSTLGIDSNGFVNESGKTYIEWNFRRAPSFFDEVCYTGTGSATTQAHNLGVVPELIIVKCRTSAIDWAVYSAALGNTGYLELSTNGGNAGPVPSAWNSTTPTSSVFSLGSNAGTNFSGNTMVAYLFATCAGVSKVTSFTGNGSSQTINCGFTGGARLVLIKRTDSTGDWYIWDSARGIVSGNDPHLSLNSTAAEVITDDTIDTDSTGFIVNQVSATNCNVNGANYIVLAVA